MVGPQPDVSSALALFLSVNGPVCTAAQVRLRDQDDHPVWGHGGTPPRPVN